jgi:hypothetical protein
MNALISVEGIILPNQPLTNIQIIDTVNKLKMPNFRGMFCRNELPHKANVKECGIINLDDSRGDGHTLVLLVQTWALQILLR